MLTTQDIEKATRDDDWQGYGYLGERNIRLTSTDSERPADPAQVAEVDAMVLAYANEHGWDYPALFAWADSKNGSWFADTVFGGRGPLADAVRLSGPVPAPRRAAGGVSPLRGWPRRFLRPPRGGNVLLRQTPATEGAP